jgi:hypothetical protein
VKTLNTAIIIAILWCAPASLLAQCDCPVGNTPDSIIQTYNIPTLSLKTTYVSFKKAPPTVATLTCVTLKAWVSTGQNFQLRNMEDYFLPDYTVDFLRTTSFSGPGALKDTLSVNSSFGPYALEAYNQPGYFVNIGPDSPFQRTLLTSTTRDVVKYQGYDSVSIQYNNKGFNSVQGSDKYSFLANSATSVSFRMAYYFCNASVLPAFFGDLRVARNNGVAQIRWNTITESPGMIFKVEEGDDGTHFTAIGDVSGKGVDNATYAFAQPLPGSTGKKYYRIAILYPNGTLKYSPVRMLDWGMASGGISIFPNPAVGRFNIQFGQAMTGQLDIQLLSVSGTMLERHQSMVNRQMVIPVELDRDYPPGTYIIKVISNTDRSVSLAKILLGN